MRKIKKKLKRIIPLWKKGLVLLGLIIIAFWVGNRWQDFFEINSVLAPDNGGILTESSVGNINILNPLSPDYTLIDRDLQQLIYGSLLEYNPLSGQIESGLATFKVAEDNRKYTLILKDSAQFSNGDDINADDIIFTFETLIQNPNFANKKLKDAFEYVTIQKKDERRVEFTLLEPNSFFLSYLTTPILRAKSFRNILIEEVLDPDHPSNKYPIGAGPYTLENIVPTENGGQRIFLRKNKHYYKQMPYIDQIVIYLYPTQTARLKHEIENADFYSHLDTTSLREIKQNLPEETYESREYVLPRYLGIFFNTDQKFTGVSALREALVTAVDKEKVLDKNPGWNRIDSFFFFEGVESWQEPDFIGARSALRDNGFPLNRSRGIRSYNKEDVNLKMVTTVNPPVFSRIAQQIIQTWEKELKIKVDLQVLDNEEMETILETKEYNIILFGQDFSENIDPLSTWHSSQIDQMNLSRLTNSSVDYLVDEYRIAGAKTDLFQMSQKLTEINAGLPIATPKYTLLLDKNLKGFSQNFGKLRAHKDRYYGIEEWYFNEKKVWDWDDDKSKIWAFIRFLFTGQ